MPFIALQAAIFVALVCIARCVPDPFVSSILDKHQRLARIGPPRLLLVGGSNVAFGFQCEKLESELHSTPTNLGIHAALGLEFILSDALSEIRPHDVVLLSLEYRLLQREAPSRELWEALLLRPHPIGGMDWARLADSGLGFFSHVINRSLKVVTGEARRRDTGIYQRKSFNEFGDVAAHRLIGPVRPYIDGEPGDIKTLGCASEDLLPVLQSFIAACEARGTRVLIFFPPILDQVYTNLRPELETYVARQKALFGDRVLGRLDDIPFPEQEFFDTCYHLTGRGSAHHTHQIIERLEAAGLFSRQSELSVPPVEKALLRPQS